eukprot:CAMPEP_0172608486 /NCGR_PEP_ID=MMETSP1068-20121228/28569_1 /TAXON_ID=35684 /ORGANISM="Pseudopedinella elastica, Strain CCMP716" /LENGTH=124 /DNA_ID=CAMNT_0013411775 /DNA_START=96 /DNA_END=467 /DNA_ORIENTATION=+
MGDENPDFHPKVGDSVWYDHNDDWAEATVKKVTGSTYTLEVDGVGLVSGVAKADMLPVEYEDDEGGGGGGEEEEGCDDELLQMLESLKFESLAPKLAAAGIRTVDDVKDSDDKALKDAGVASNL